jgi:hypothetical protein
LKIKSQRDFYSGLMFAAVGVGYAIGATDYPMGTSATPGPGYFPLILSVVMTILGIVVLFNSLVVDTEDGEPVGAIAWRPLLVIVFTILLFAVTLPRLGLILSIPLLIISASLAGDEFGWMGVLIASVVLTIGSYLVFIKGLGLIMPLWPTFLA